MKATLNTQLKKLTLPRRFMKNLLALTAMKATANNAN